MQPCTRCDTEIKIASILGVTLSKKTNKWRNAEKRKRLCVIKGKHLKVAEIRPFKINKNKLERNIEEHKELNNKEVMTKFTGDDYHGVTKQIAKFEKVTNTTWTA